MPPTSTPRMLHLCAQVYIRSTTRLIHSPSTIFLESIHPMISRIDSNMRQPMFPRSLDFRIPNRMHNFLWPPNLAVVSYFP